MKAPALTRRNFVAGTGILGLAAATVGAASVFAAEVETFDETYDVVVIGYGFAGCASSIAAIDAGAQRVLLTDAAPKGHEGGNSRYCAQCCAYGRDYDSALAYYKRLSDGYDCPDDMLETFVGGMAGLPEQFVRLGVEEPCIWSDYIANTPAEEVNPMIALLQPMGDPEHPQEGNGVHIDTITAHPGVSDAAFYLAAHDTVEETEGIEIWFESPARHFIIDDEGSVTGVQIEREG